MSARKELGEEGMIEFVQDPDPNSGIQFLLKLPAEDELHLTFTFIMRRKEDPATGAPAAPTTINGLTFITASNSREIENLVTREFHADPNLHKNPNVNLVGDGNYTTDVSSAVQFEYTWRWRPPAEDRLGVGWRNTCSFVEYDQRAHKLMPLAQFSFWVPRPSRMWPPSPGIGPGDLLSSPPPKLRVSPSRNNDGDQTDGELPSPTTLEFDGPGLEYTMTNVPAVKVDNCPRPAESAIGDDGPLFRATIKSLEQKTSNLRTKMKKVLKRAEQARQAQIVCNDAFSAFMESLRDASTSGHAPGIQPALDHYFERTYREILTFEKNNELNLQKLIIDPLTKLYHMDLKQAESKKRDFEEESRDYYNYVSRYLGIRNDPSKEKKKIESETKYQTKRKNFELKRFDYSTFMQDLHGGRKEQEVLAQLTKYADAQARGFLNTAKKVQELLPELEALDYEVKETAKEFQLQRTEREERRRLLEKNNQQYVEPESVPSFIPPTTPNASAPTSSDILGFNHNTGFERLGMGTSSVRAVSSGSEGVPEGLMSPVQAGKSGSGSLKYRGYGENTVDKETERRKEGLLWALSRPGSHVDPKGLNKQAWHKYWVVLAGGQLCEYTNWKQKLGLHNDPINLKMASVREARNSERRFCFEVVTPQYKRVYQATSEEDMNNWISSINNAVKSTIESGGSIKNFDVTPISNETEVSALKNIPSALTGKSSHRDHHASSSAPVGNSQAGVYRRTTVGARPGPQRRNSSNFNDDPEKLLQMVRDSDPSNSSCADCGSQVKTEWVSINLGIVLCIECSGLHRSLGTHISKVRSLTLDVTSFTPDLVDLLTSIGNAKSNSVWESRLDPSTRPNAQSSRESRLKFITAKYVNRSFVAPLSPTLSVHATADELLLDAARKNNLQSAVYALALQANPNCVDPVNGTHVAVLALAAADPPRSIPAAPAVPTTPAVVVVQQPHPISPGSPGSPRSPLSDPIAIIPNSSSAGHHSTSSISGSTISEDTLAPPGSLPNSSFMTSSSSNTNTSGTTPAAQTTFALAELIVQNGGELPMGQISIPLSMAARNYVAHKVSKRLQQQSPAPSRGASTHESSRRLEAGFMANSIGGFGSGSGITSGLSSNNSNNITSGLTGAGGISPAGGNGIPVAATQPGTIITEGFGNSITSNTSSGKDKSKRISSGARLHRSPILER
ncbi:hypothetical protein BZA77DRAFT_350536 [Pyronema omphalodes]|nr:hypothetical protein BZA77DRAFT_350536 [Pyronema omphalodes]